MSYHKYPPTALSANQGGGTSVVGQITGIGADGVFEVTGANIIPRSSALAGLQISTGLAADISGIQVVSDIGEFVNIYTDAACTVKIATMVLTPDETVPVILPAATLLFLRAVKDVDIDQAGSYLAMNFLG